LNKPSERKASLPAIIAIFAGGNLINMGLRLVGGVLTARFAPPAVLGFFYGISLVLGYAPFAQLGILNGLNRELPYYIGRDDRQRAHELASAAQCWALGLGGMGAIALVALALWYASTGRLDLTAGWIANAFGLLFLFYSQMYLQITFRTSGDFARLSIINVVQSSAALLFVSLVWLYGFYGLCLRSVCVGFVGAALLWKFRPLRVKPHWNKQHIRHLFKIGAPIFIVGQIYSWWIVLDSTLVLKYTGVKGFGLYQLAIMADQAIGILPLAVSQIVYPKMAEEYGRSGSLKNIILIAVKPILVTVVVLVPVVIVGWLALPLLVEWLLPKYVDGISAARWSMLSAAAMAFAPVNNAFNVIKRQDLYLVAIVLGMTAYFICLMALNKSGVKLINFSQAILVGQTTYLLLCYAILVKLIASSNSASAI
jgi:O-antigen/teichoic acid export membrane protein